nr:MAG: Transcriptional regulator, RHH-like, CopG [Bacteriophage sp.]
MAARKDLTDRNGKSQEMVKRSFRLTDEENAMLNHLIAQTGLTLRDLMAQLVEEKYNKLKKN